MRRRIVLAATPLLVLLLLALAVPAAVVVASANTAALVRDRAADAARFAAGMLTDADPGAARVHAELDDYAALFDSPVWLVGRDGAVEFSSVPGPPPATTADELDAVLAGRTPAEPGVVFPWGPDRVQVVAPVGFDSQVVAAIVIDAPTDRLRARTAGTWAVVAAAGLVPVGVGFWLLWPMSRWVLRPVRQLDRVAGEMAAGALDARASDRTGPDELRSLARSFNGMADAVSDTVRRQSQFVADASHQLRTPLAGVRLSVENLGALLPAGRDAEESYADAISGVDAMSATVAGLLQATRIDRRPPGPVAVGDELGAAARAWRADAADAGMTLDAQVDDAVVVGPAGGLRGVADELVANAITRSGGTRVRVRGSVARSRYVLVVEDDGVGLDAGERALATQRLWRSPSQHGSAGSGLGLAIVAQATEAAGGALRLAAAPGGGLRVTVDLPLADGVRASGLGTSAPPLGASAPASSPPPSAD